MNLLYLLVCLTNFTIVNSCQCLYPSMPAWWPLRNRIKAVKEFCEKNEGHTKFLFPINLTKFDYV